MESCKFCDQKFTTLMKLSDHQASVHGWWPCLIYDHEPKEKCRTCGAQFITRKQLTEHMRRVHEKPFHCNKCNFKTGERRDLGRHLKVKHKIDALPSHLLPRTNDGIPPSSSNQEADVDHPEVNHPEGDEVRSSTDQTEQQEASSSSGHGISPLKCQKCDFQMVKRSGMELHMRTNHGAATDDDNTDSSLQPKVSPPSATTTSTSPTVTNFEKGTVVPYPEVRNHYNLRVERMKMHEFGTRFIDL